jgi:hypothetical protein
VSDANAGLVDAGDIDELLRHVDRLCSARDWQGVDDLRDRSRKALERGRQLWPVASHAEYRLALEAPARWAASVLHDGAGRFALGPLPEVAASTHTWEELAPHVLPGPAGAMAAHERVVRGEDLTDDDRVPGGVLDTPQRLQSWEPTYPVAVYKADDADFGEPALVPFPHPAPNSAGRTVSRNQSGAENESGAAALRDLAATWVRESNGVARAVAVDGTALDAIGALHEGRTRVADIGLAEALARMAWTAASGGAHGRRAGMAAGRFSAWWALANVTDLADHWPPDADALGSAATQLRWLIWEPAPSTGGWALRLAIEDPARPRAWALGATDHA